MVDDARAVTPPDGFLDRVKAWFKEDHEARIEWAKEAETDYEFAAPGGEGAWEEEDRLRLKAQNRPCISFNRILPVVQSVVGMEINDRKEVTFKPRTTQHSEPMPQVDPMTGQPMPQQSVPGADDQGPAETFTAGAEYMRDQCDAEDEESDAFQDAVICGMGWVETRVDYEMNPDGDLREDRIDPLEMVWDCKATKRNLIDARRVWRVREIDKDEAKQEFDETDLSKLDASWARLDTVTQPHDREAAKNYENNQTDFDASRKTVTMVEMQYITFETSYKAANPRTGEVIEVDKAGLKNLKANAAKAGIPIEIAKHKNRVIYTVVIGDDIIEYKRAQSQKCFKFQAITGYRDRNNKQWVGLVRSMRDPQKWANALFSSVLHQIQVSGKGLMAEKDAFDDWQKAEKDWANAAKIVQTKVGALGQHPKVREKQQNTIPAAMFQLMQFALGAFRDVTGVNVESMGLADRQQAASLEYQRRQAATTILAPFFDGLRRFRKDNGRIILDLMRNYLSDGRLVRVVGPDYEKYVPLLRDDETVEYDIIVDESASSPNQKEASWAILQNLLPVIGANLSPSSMAVIMKASPLPESLVEEFKEQAAKDAEQQGPSPEQVQLQMQQQQQQFDMQMAAAKAQQDSERNNAEIQLKQMDMALQAQTFEANKLKIAADLQGKILDVEGKKAQMGHDMTMREKEMSHEAGQTETEMMGPQMPALVQGLAQSQAMLAQGLESGLTALAQALVQVSQGVQSSAVAMQQAAAAMAAPKVAQLSADGLTATIEPVSLQ